MEPMQPVSNAARSFFIAFRRLSLVTNAATKHCSRRLHAHQGPLSTAELTQNRSVRARHGAVAGHSQVRKLPVQAIDDATDASSNRTACVTFSGRRRSLGTVGTSQVSRRSHSQGNILRSKESLEGSLRCALRTLTKPCVVVTTAAPGHDEDSFSGATLSSFDTVSLHPQPYISFNIKIPSRTYNNFQTSRQICVHILSATPAGVSIADTFTKSYSTSREPFNILADRGVTIEHTSARSAPQLQLEGANIAWLMCELDETTTELEVGDHMLCTFAVKDIILAPEAQHSSQEALSYGQQSFRGLGERIESISVKQTSDAAMIASRTSPVGVVSHRERPRVIIEADSRFASSTSKQDSSPTFNAAASFHTLSRRRSRYTPWVVRYRSSTSFQSPPQQSSNTTPLRNAHSDALSHLDYVEDTTHDTPSAIPISTTVDVVDPAEPWVLKQTLNDFMCHSQKRPAMRSTLVRKTQGEIEKAQIELEEMLRTLDSSSQAVETLEQTINAHKRYIAIDLAINATEDLNEMLDEGRISMSRVRFIESCIEKGQLALIDDAEAFMALDNRSRFIKKHLPDAAAFKQVEEFFRTALSRLRDLVDEDD